MRKMNMMLIIALVATLLFAGSQTQAAPGSRYFPETGHGIRGAFQAYWEQQGGLERFGYPLTDEISERSALNGQTYTVQYFERAEFELHPENAAPYDVLLTQLGTLRYQQQYPSPPADEQISTDSPTLFPQTGKHVGRLLLGAWQRLGGLANVGYPISEELAEQSPLDGKVYMVQYFERAEFEYHPENSAPYDVLLVQLGRFAYNTNYGPKPTPTAVPTSTSPAIIQIATGINSSPPAIAKRSLFWLSSDCGFCGYDVDKAERYVVTDRPGVKANITGNGKLLTWLEASPTSGGDVHTFDPATRTEIIIFYANGYNVGDFALDGNYLYYVGTAAGKRGIYQRSLSDNKDTLIGMAALYMGKLMATDGKLIWSVGSTLHLYRPNDGVDRIIVNNQQGIGYYGLSGENIVWTQPADSTTNDRRIHVYNVATNVDQIVVRGTVDQPVISGNTVAWVNGIYTPNARTVSIYNLSNGQSAVVVKPTDVTIHDIALVGPDVLAYNVNVGLSGSALYVVKLP